MSLKITNSDPAVATYNAYQVEVTYDSKSLKYDDQLIFQGILLALIQAQTGTLKITGYGDDRDLWNGQYQCSSFKTTEVGTS